MDALEVRQVVAFIVIAGCFGALLAIHFQVELTAMRREIRLLRRRVRRRPMNPATRAAIRPGGTTARRPQEEELKSP